MTDGMEWWTRGEGNQVKVVTPGKHGGQDKSGGESGGR